MAGLATGESITNADAKFTSAGIDLVRARADHVDPKTKKVRLSDGGEIAYDRLLLGIGANPVIPPIEGRDLRGVFALRALSDAEEIKTYLDTVKPRKLVFIGAGFISLELASLLYAHRPDCNDITVIELLGHPLPLMIDSELGIKLQDYMVEKGLKMRMVERGLKMRMGEKGLKMRMGEKGLKMRMGEKVKRIYGTDGAVAGIELADGERVNADMVFLNVGVRANTKLAEDIGLQTGQFGIKVNSFLETSDPDILAAGDSKRPPSAIPPRPTLHCLDQLSLIVPAGYVV